MHNFLHGIYDSLPSKTFFFFRWDKSFNSNFVWDFFSSWEKVHFLCCLQGSLNLIRLSSSISIPKCCFSHTLFNSFLHRRSFLLKVWIFSNQVLWYVLQLSIYSITKAFYWQKACFRCLTQCVAQNNISVWKSAEAHLQF